MTTITVTLTKGDRLRAIQASLKNPDGTAVDLTTSSVAFLMVRAADATVKINYAAASVVGAPTAGVVTYAWTAGDVDTAGDFYAWFRRTDGGKVEHFPHEGRRLQVVLIDAP